MNSLLLNTVLTLNSLFLLPQLIYLLRKKQGRDLSLTTAIGFLLLQLILLTYAIDTAYYTLILSTLVSTFFCLTIITLAFWYSYTAIPAEDIIAQLPGHVYWKDKNGIFIGGNTNNWKNFGLHSLQEFVGKTDYDILEKSEADNVRLIDQQVMREKKTLAAEETASKAYGSDGLYLSNKAPLKNKRGKIIGILGCSLDIIESKQQTLDKLAILENIIAVMPGNVYWMDKDGVYQGCNDNAAKAIGLASRKEMIGKRNLDMPSFVKPEIIDPINKNVMQTGKKITLEEPAILKDDSQAIFLSSKVPIENSQGEIAGMVGISIDITEMKNNEKALQKAKDAAETANQAKNQFLQNIRHDLRTPFTGILSVAEMLVAQETTPDKQELLQCIVDSSQQLLDHLNDILEFTALEQGKLPILEKPFSLAQLIEGLYKTMLPSAIAKNLCLECTIDDTVPSQIIGDKARTQRILINLLSNAIKFTEQGSVKLQAQLKKSDTQQLVIQFTITDTGIGIPADKYNVIFESFNRLTAAYSGVYAGKGLGLRSVKQLLDEIGGQPKVTSTLGKGSTFALLVPYRVSLSC